MQVLALRAIIIAIRAVVGAVITVVVVEHCWLLVQIDIYAQSIACPTCGTTSARLR
jgi:hypothetical protein